MLYCAYLFIILVIVFRITKERFLNLSQQIRKFRKLWDRYSNTRKKFISLKIIEPRKKRNNNQTDNISVQEGVTYK